MIATDSSGWLATTSEIFLIEEAFTCPEDAGDVDTRVEAIRHRGVEADDTALIGANQAIGAVMVFSCAALVACMAAMALARFAPSAWRFPAADPRRRTC